MIKLLRLTLFLSLMLTSISLGAARGTIELAGQVVICTGEGIVIRNIPGAPSKTVTHICPDMALFFLNNVTTTFDFPVAEYHSCQLSLPVVTAAVYSKGAPTAAARDPPWV